MVEHRGSRLQPVLEPPPHDLIAPIWASRRSSHSSKLAGTSNHSSFDTGSSSMAFPTHVVTHSPQVAARGGVHLRVSKQAARGRTATRVDALDAPERREEIARMLAGETVTEAARAAADDLLGAAV